MAAPWLGALAAALIRKPADRAPDPAQPRDRDLPASPWAIDIEAPERLRFPPFGYRGWRCWL